MESLTLLHQEYGKLTIEAKVLQAKLLDLEQRIIALLNEQKRSTLSPQTEATPGKEEDQSPSD